MVLDNVTSPVGHPGRSAKHSTRAQSHRGMSQPATAATPRYGVGDSGFAAYLVDDVHRTHSGRALGDYDDVRGG